MAQPELLQPNWLDLPLELWAHIYKHTKRTCYLTAYQYACVCKWVTFGRS